MRASDERIRAMLLGRRAIRVFAFPGFAEDAEPVEIGVRILLEQDIDAARVDAVQYVSALARKRNLEPAEMLQIDSEVVDREVQRAIIQRAFVEPPAADQKEPRPFFESITQVRQLDTVITRTLFEVYLDHQNYVNPLSGLSDDEFRELADALSKGPNAEATLGLYDAPTLRRLVRTLASRHATAPTGKSDSGGSTSESTGAP